MTTTPQRCSLLAYGFRPFFLAAGLTAVIYVPWWAGSVVLGWPLSTAWPPMLWHGHEMLFGFTGAAIAGFLLTAVPSWTGQRGFSGVPLAAIAAVWLLARLAILTSGQWPLVAIATLDLAFLPLLAVLLSVPLLRSKNRNTPLLAVIAGLWACNAVFYWGLGHQDAPIASRAIQVGIDIVLLLVTIIGGRIVPAFTASGLRQTDPTLALRAWPWLTPIVVALMVAHALADAIVPDTGWVAAIAAAAALTQSLRLAQWRSLHTLGQPIVWVLHIAYAWLILGLALKSIALLGGASIAAFWLHALTIGAVTSMILGVMTRASLGHTGRPLVVSPAIVACYLLTSVAAIVRVFALGLLAISYPAIILVTGVIWTSAFALFLWVYGPILCRPRIDGRPG